MESSYDRVPYPSLSYVQSHPDRLASVATLLGMRPAPVEHCRVLELGCAGGWNLIAMAYGLPGSEFVGIDNSARQILDGQSHVMALGLENITFSHQDILDVGAELGRFDYIIAHGVFSWVPHHVQEALLQVCKEHLAPNGVAYVSYNTYPGWHMLASVREMMLYRTRDVGDPQERAAKAREFLDFLAGSIPAESGPYGNFLHTYASLLRGETKGEHPAGDSFLLHDELEDVNEPLYFHEFAERAAAHGLQYLGEAELRTMADTNFPPEVSAGLRDMSGSIVDLEQYMDFFRNQTLRKTLLCHEDVALSRVLTPDRLSSLSVASYAEPVTSDADIHAVTVAQFRSADGAVLSTDHPLTKAAMLHLAEIWPRVIAIGDLVSAAWFRLGIGQVTPGDDRLELEAQVLNTNLLKGHVYSGYLVELHAFVPRLVLAAGECPLASPVARLQAQGGSKVTNLRHERVELDELNRYLLVRLDGCHSRAALAQALEEGPVAEGLLVIHRDGQPVVDAASMRELLAESVQKRIAWLARAGLLLA